MSLFNYDMLIYLIVKEFEFLTQISVLTMKEINMRWLDRATFNKICINFVYLFRKCVSVNDAQLDYALQTRYEMCRLPKNSPRKKIWAGGRACQYFELF